MAIVIDASGAIMGRLASHVAKRLLEGEEIVIVNAEKAVISGSRDAILAEYRNRRERGTQRFGPFYPRVPHLIVKRAVRGMIPYQMPRGRAAYRRLRVEIGVPATYAKMTLVKPEGLAKAVPGMTVGELSKDLGATVRTQKVKA
jgi:large subunit ribosomal protein L13